MRNEARATELARAYISGKPYAFVEQKRKPENECKFRSKIIQRIVAMVEKYGDRKITYDDIEKWSKLD